MLAQLPPFADPGALDLFSVFEQTLYGVLPPSRS
jgi:hypothetical protein